MNLKDYIVLAVISLLLLFAVAKCKRAENEIKFLTSQNEQVKQEHQNAIQKYIGAIDRLNSKDRFLVDSIQKLNAGYRSLLSRTQNIQIADSLQKQEIKKGTARYGSPLVNQFQNVLASIYGNNAFDELAIMDDRLENQIKVNTLYKGVVLHKDTIIEHQSITIKKLAKKAEPNFWQRLKDWVIGAFIGGGIFLLL